MSDNDSTPRDPQRRANELYWNSDRTVEEIVGDLKVSRSALYSSIKPQAAGSDCPHCGERMVFTNRTNREGRVGTCVGCSVESRVPSPGEAEAVAAAEGGARGSTEDASHWSRFREDLAGVSPQRAAMVGGAAALGVVLGAAATRMLQDRI